MVKKNTQKNESLLTIKSVCNACHKHMNPLQTRVTSTHVFQYKLEQKSKQVGKSP